MIDAIKLENIVNEKFIGKEENPINQNEIYNLASSVNIKNNKNEALLIIDAQRDFIDMEKGALAVQGAVDDIKRIIKFIYDNIENLSAIYTTIDTHSYDSIFHPFLWKTPNGEYVKPFTEITLEKIENKEVIPVYKNSQTDYVKKLKEQGSQNLIIWTYHCIYGTDGWLIEKQLSNMLAFFEASKKTSIKKIIKGTDKFTEMYGAIKPEVLTGENHYNNDWVKEIKDYDKIYICGEAKDYCVYETIKQFCEIYKSKKNITEKIYFMDNCCSSIGDKNICAKKYEELANIYGIKLITV